MGDLVRALGISAGILIPVVIFIVLISIAVVRRGETGEADAGHHVPGSLAHVTATATATTAAAPAPKAAKPSGPVSQEVSVAEILLFGTGLFVLSILALLALSLIQHLN
jgi:hypothetical protein